MAEACRCPGSGTVAGVALQGSDEMVAWLACGNNIVVACTARFGDVVVAEAPAMCRMAFIAIHRAILNRCDIMQAISRWWRCWNSSISGYTKMAIFTQCMPRCVQAVVIVYGHPGTGAMAFDAIGSIGDNTVVNGVGGWRTGCRSTDGMTAPAVAQYRHMVHPTHVIPCQGGVAGFAVVTGLNMAGTLDHGAGIGQQIVAGGAFPRGATELTCGMASVALHRAVSPGEREASSKVIEGVINRGGHDRCRETEQHPYEEAAERGACRVVHDSFSVQDPVLGPDFGFLEIFGCVAATTVTTKPSTVDIIIFMTRCAVVGGCTGWRTQVAGVTGQSFVFASQFVIGLAIMVELPQAPAVGVVAVVAGFAQATFMIVIFFVAVVTTC